MRGCCNLPTTICKHATVRLGWCGVLLLAMLCSCQRREIMYAPEAEVAITADWSRAGLETEQAYGSTLLFYPQDGGAPRTLLMGDRKQGTARLPLGRYNVVMFNRSFNDFSAIAFRGVQVYDQLEAYAKKVETRTEGRYLVASPEKLAVAILRNFEVTAGMIGNYATEGKVRTTEAKLHFEPTLLTQTISVSIHIQGVSYVKEAVCTLDEIPLSVFLTSGRMGEETVVQEFALNQPTYDPGSATDGTLNGSFNVFGLNLDVPHTIVLNALLTDGKTVVKQQLTNIHITRQEDEAGNISFHLESLVPEPMPKPEASGGLDAEVGGWGEEETEELPI